MSRPRKPLTVKNLMIAVAAFGLSVKVGLDYGHSGSYWRESKFHARAAEIALWRAKFVEEGRADLDADTASNRAGVVARERDFARREEILRRTYLRAALLPWLPNTPEPPSP